MRCAFNEFTIFFAARSFDVFQNSHRVTSSRSENFFFSLSLSLSRMKSTTKRKTVVAALLSFSVYLLCPCAYSLIAFCRVVYLLRVGKSQRHNFEGEGTHFFFNLFFTFFFDITLFSSFPVSSEFLLSTRALGPRSHFYHKQIKSNLTEKERAQKFANATRMISGERERERERSNSFKRQRYAG